MSAGIEHEIDRAGRFGQRLEDLVYNAAKDGKVVYSSKNDDLLLSYWSLVFDYSKGIVCLLANKFHSPAFALMRPLVEAVTREHIVLVGSEDDVKKIYAGGPQSRELLVKYGVEFVMTGPREQALPAFDEGAWSAYPLVAQRGPYRLYRVPR